MSLVDTSWWPSPPPPVGCWNSNQIELETTPRVAPLRSMSHFRFSREPVGHIGWNDVLRIALKVVIFFADKQISWFWLVSANYIDLCDFTDYSMRYQWKDRLARQIMLLLILFLVLPFVTMRQQSILFSFCDKWQRNELKRSTFEFSFKLDVSCSFNSWNN